MAIDEVHFAGLRDRFTDEWKKVEHYVADRRPLTKNLVKRAEYRDKLTNAYNSICKYLIRAYHSSKKTDEKLDCIARIGPYSEKCKRAFDSLKLAYDWPAESLTLIDIRQIRSLEEPLPAPVIETEPQPTTSTADQSTTNTLNQSGIASSTSIDEFVDANGSNNTNLDDIIQNLSNIDIDDSVHAQTDENSDSVEQTIQESTTASQGQTNGQGEQIEPAGENNTGGANSSSAESSDSEDQSRNSNSGLNSNQTVTMPQSPEDFFAVASKILNYKFEGDPLKLQSFLEDIELVEDIAKPESAGICLKFVKSRITGRAREQLPEDIGTIKKITDALTKNIKCDSSKVIEGRLTALRISKGNVAKFAEEAEKLSEAFERSLVDEEFTKTKAKELTIAKTKELCRKVSRSEVVEGIIASTKYDSPKEVIAAFITESDIARKKKQDQQNYQKRSGEKGQNKGQKFNKNKKFNKNDNKSQNKGKYQKNRNDNNGGKGRSNRNEHTIRIVNDASAPVASSNGSSGSGEQVFRLAQS